LHNCAFYTDTISLLRQGQARRRGRSQGGRKVILEQNNSYWSPPKNVIFTKADVIRTAGRKNWWAPHPL